jgi:cell shape-determining protein MreC
MRNPKFTTKQEYLQYRKDWKDEYMELSQVIRDHKLIRKYSSQACGKAVQMIDGDAFSYDNISKYFRYVEQNKNENEKLQALLLKYKDCKKYLSGYRKEARLMMEELTNAKIEANLQYIASKNLATV